MNEILIVGEPPISREAIEASLSKIGANAVFADRETVKEDNMPGAALMGLHAFSRGLDEMYDMRDFMKTSHGGDVVSFGMKYTGSRKAKARKAKAKRKKR